MVHDAAAGEDDSAILAADSAGAIALNAAARWLEVGVAGLDGAVPPTSERARTEAREF